MIVYNFEFEELADGTFRIHWDSPSGHATEKEIKFAKKFIGLNKAIFDKLKEEMGGTLHYEN